jgi:hypothetical protein
VAGEDYELMVRQFVAMASRFCPLDAYLEELALR